MEKMIKKVNLIVLSILILIFIILFFGFYYINNLLPKKIYIDDNNVSEILEENNKFEVVGIERGSLFSKIIIRINLEEEYLKKYINYTLGPGENYYLNYSIILSNNTASYRLKTIVMDRNVTDLFDRKDPDGKIYIKTVFLNKDFFINEYNIGIMQEDYKENYKEKYKNYYKNLGLIGGKNEKNEY